MTENKFGVITNWCIYENVDGVKKWLNFDEVVDLLNTFNEENENFKKALRIVYSTKLTEPTKHTIEQIAKHCGVDLE